MLLDRPPPAMATNSFAIPKSLIVDALTIGNQNILIYDEVPKVGCNNRPRIQDMNVSQGHVVDKPMNYVTSFSSGMRVGLSALSKLHIYYSSKENHLRRRCRGALSAADQGVFE